MISQRQDAAMSLLNDWPLLIWLPAALAAASSMGLLILIGGLRRVFARAPRLTEATTALACGSLTVVVPAYNEAANIGPCLSSLLRSEPPCPDWRVLLVDDRSSDATVELALATVQAQAGPADRFALLDAGPRPTGQRWVGKNWACAQAMQQVDSDWVLFVDADLRLQPQTLQRAMNQVQADAADLLSLAPRLQCSCLAEWMVQPIIASLLGLGFPIEAANDPASPVAFAAGPFRSWPTATGCAICWGSTPPTCRCIPTLGPCGRGGPRTGCWVSMAMSPRRWGRQLWCC